MERRTRCAIVGALMGVALAAGGTILAIAAVFPATVGAWSAQGRALSAPERIAAGLCVVCLHFGIYALPPLAALFLAGAVWMAAEARGSRGGAGQP